MPTIEAKVTGARRAGAIPQWQIPIDELSPGGSPLTLRALIDRVVRAEVAAFRDRQAERRLARFLTRRELDQQAERGRVDLGGRELRQAVDTEAAVGVALEAFEDGIYFVVIDGRQCMSLDEQVAVGADSRVTFLRLVPLAGG